MRIARAYPLIVLGSAIFLFTSNVHANHVTYSIEYSKSSIKEIPLEKAKISGQLFRNGKLVEYIQIITNLDREFTILNDHGSNLTLSIFSIEGENKFKLKCSGKSSLENTNIIIECKPNSSRKN